MSRVTLRLWSVIFVTASCLSVSLRPWAQETQVRQVKAGRVVTEDQLEALEDRIARLEEKIDNLASQMASQSQIDRLTNHLKQIEQRQSALGSVRSSIPPGLGQWRKLRQGMGRSDVRSLLGEPIKIEGGSFENWYYNKKHPTVLSEYVRFYKGRVDSWKEPAS